MTLETWGHDPSFGLIPHVQKTIKDMGELLPCSLQPVRQLPARHADPHGIIGVLLGKKKRWPW